MEWLTLRGAAAAFGLSLGLAALPALAGDLMVERLPVNPYGVIDTLYAVNGPVLDGTPVRLLPAANEALPAPALRPGDTRRLTLFHFNDLHNYLTEPHAKRGDTHRFSQMVKAVRAARAEVGEDDIVLFLSAGDDHTGGVFDELTGFTPREFVVDPAYTAYTLAGVDMAVLGNHEFDRGAAMLATWIDSAPLLPILSANVTGSDVVRAGEHYHAAFIAVVNGVRIGVIGLTTAEDTRLGTAENAGIAIASPLETVKALLPPLAEATDMVVLLTHLGYGAGTDRSGKAGAERRIGEGDSAVAELAGSLVKTPVVLVGGHTHTALNTDGLKEVFAGVPVLQAGGHGSHLGRFSADLVACLAAVALDRPEAGLIAIKKADARVQPGDEKYAALQHDGDWDAEFQTLVIDPLRVRLDRVLAEPIATMAADDAVSTDTTLARRYIGETPIANLMNDLLVARSASFPNGAVDIAGFNATGLVKGIPASGPLTFSDWFEVMPFTDSVIIVEMTGAQIQAMLDSNAKRIVRPEEAASLDLTGYVSRGFLHFSSALRYTIALGAATAEARAVDVTIHGTPLEQVKDKTFRVAFGSYVGNGGFSEAWNGRTISAGVPGDIVGFDLTALPRRDTGFVYRNEVVSRIRDLGTLTPEAGARLDGRLTVVQVAN